MKKICSVISLMIILLFFGCDRNDTEKQVKKVKVDRIVHLMNPEKPIKGNIILEIEKIKEINPYDTEDFGLRWIDFKRDIDGEVIFFTPTGSEVHRFNPEGKYLGNLIRHGQGPGEFSRGQFLNPFFVNNQLYVTGGQKLAKFDKSGNFIKERKTGQYPLIFVDENRFFIREREGRNIDWNVKISLIEMDSKGMEDFKETIFFQKENVGAIEKPGTGGYTNPWGIPDILFTYDRLNQRMFVCLNTEYKVYAMNLSGETEYVVEKPYKKIKITTGDKRDILTSFFQREPEDWQIDSFPDTLVAIKSIKCFPNGYLAVYKVTDINTYEIDIFNPDGHYIYSVTPLENIDLDEVKFYSFGFARIETKADGFMIYEEYRIKNIPEIFML